MPTMDYERQARRALERISASPSVHPGNKDLIESYHRHLVLGDISPAQRQKLMCHLKIIAEYIGNTRFEYLQKGDIEELVAWLYTRGTTQATVSSYKQTIKQFWKWMNGGEEPPETNWIRRSQSSYSRLLPHSLLTPHDVQAMIAGCTNDRDRAFIALLWETGARIGELIDLRVGDIEQGAIGKHVVVSGKTGSRRLLLLESESYIDDWLTAHPNPQPTAPLWCKIQQGTPDEQLGYNYIRLRLLERARERAGIEKPVNPHHFRHSRATYLANYLTEAQLCEWFGWTRGSRVPGRYVHLSGRDIDRAHFHMLEQPGYERLSAKQ